MSFKCQITGKKITVGNKIHRSGLAKKKKGVGQHVTKEVKRTFKPNIQTKRVWVPELNRFVKVKLAASVLKTIAKKGAYNVLKEAKVI